VVAGVAAPLLRKRVKAPPLVMQSVAFGAPFGLAVAVRRSPVRDVAVCTLQMWAYLAAYKAPHDDPQALEHRVHVNYPIAIDRFLGAGQLPTVRLQRALTRRGFEGAEWRVLDRVLVWAHWVWFMVPHGSLLYILLRYPQRFARAAAMTYAVFDLGAIVYWVLPTAPPWYAAAKAREERIDVAHKELHERVDGIDADAGLEGSEQPEVRRMMVEYGEFFWGDGWDPLYSVLGGNPLAAMPSLHFATSVMAALLLTEVGPVAGFLGWSYAGTLGFALVYLGEHYAVDLLAGAALTAGVRLASPRAGPWLDRVGRAVSALEAQAHGAV
jgi:membrane-associated phospholipid phosphatase